MTNSQLIEYRDGDTLLEGYLSAPANKNDKLPAIIIIHDWSGRNAFACEKADKVAALGYYGFALDMYGKGRIGKTTEEKSALMQPLISNRKLLLNRVQAALDVVKKHPDIDTNKIAVIGFCFGGLCALDLARSGAELVGAVSFHGLLHAPEGAAANRILAKILAMHGFDDPMVTPDKVMTFGEEMTAAKADWQLHMYGNTMHAFTNPKANDPDFGTVYNKTADMRSWNTLINFFKEIF